MISPREIDIIETISNLLRNHPDLAGEALDRWNFVRELILTASDPTRRLAFLEEMLQGFKELGK